MNKPLGGRGKKAPYETQVIRVPSPIASQVEQFIESYRLSLITGDDESDQKSKVPSDTALLNYGDAVERSREILKAKKSAAESLAKLLQVLYGGTISKEDLR